MTCDPGIDTSILQARNQLTSALFLATTSRHVLYALPTPICCRSLVSTQPLLTALSALLPPQYGIGSWNSLPAGIRACSSPHTFRLLKTHFSSPYSGSHKCHRFGLWSTLCTQRILFTYVHRPIGNFWVGQGIFLVGRRTFLGGHCPQAPVATCLL